MNSEKKEREGGKEMKGKEREGRKGKKKERKYDTNPTHEPKIKIKKKTVGKK